jgi:hypothetical protein
MLFCSDTVEVWQLSAGDEGAVILDFFIIKIVNAFLDRDWNP